MTLRLDYTSPENGGDSMGYSAEDRRAMLGLMWAACETLSQLAVLTHVYGFVKLVSLMTEFCKVCDDHEATGKTWTKPVALELPSYRARYIAEKLVDIFGYALVRDQACREAFANELTGGVFKFVPAMRHPYMIDLNKIDADECMERKP